MTSERPPGIGVRLYKAFLLLLPDDLSSEFGDEMLGVFQDRMAEAPTAPARLVVLGRGLTDVIVQAVAARWSEIAAPALTTSWGALATDIRLSVRRLLKDRTTSTAAIVSLGLAVGACTSAFRLVDGLLFRPLPVEAPHELHSLSYRTTIPNLPPEGWDSGPYIMFRGMRDAVSPDAHFFATSRSYRASIRVAGSTQHESAYVQRVSGETFPVLGIRPTIGRILTPADDVTPGEHPVAVISEDYWARRFGRRSSTVGSSLQIGSVAFEIVGVIHGPFSGMETGHMTDVFVPTMMGGNVLSPFQNGLIGYLRISEADKTSVIHDRLRQSWVAFQEDRTADIASWSQQRRERFLADTELLLSTASAGTSDVQRQFRRPLTVLSVLVVLVLLITSTNVANLLIVRAGRRRLDSAVRVSIGAGRARLIQLALVESGLIAIVATALGLVLSAWAVPTVLATLSETGDPVSLAVPFDLRLAAFSLGLAISATAFFGLVPAWRAAQVQPIDAIKSGSAGAISRRTPHALIAVQAGFCFVVLFVAGLFAGTSRDLSELTTGFRSEGLLALSIEARPSASPAAWRDVANEVAATPGVEQVALAEWPLLQGWSTNGVIAYGGVEPDRDMLTEFLCVSPGWIEVMGVDLLEGRDFLSDDRYPQVALVNEAFVRTYVADGSPVGRTFERVGFMGDRTPSRVVGVVRNVRYLDLRGAPPPTAYIPCESTDADGSSTARGFSALMVRTNGGDPETLYPALRDNVSKAGTGFVLVEARTQDEINRRHTVRERLLASLGGFFGVVALLLAGIGLYGVMHDSVQQRQRELSVRIALGSPVGSLAGDVASRSLLWLTGGLVVGLASAAPVFGAVQSLLYGADSLTPTMLLLPAGIVALTGLAAAAPGTLKALRTDPAQALRSE